MKRTLGILLIAAGVAASSGCELLNKKEDNGGNGGATEENKGGGGAAAMDLSTMVQAPPMIPLGEGAAVGMKIGTSMKAGTFKSAANTAIVGEDGDMWLVETDSGLSGYGASAKDQLIGMWVKKDGGKVVKAVIGKKGEAGKEIKVTAYTAPAKTEAPKGEDTEVKLKMGGPYPAKLYTTDMGNGKTAKSWAGTSGELEGVALKMDAGANASYELKAMPEMVELKAGETTIKAKKLVYDNGMEMYPTKNKVVVALASGSAKMVTSSSETMVTLVAEDAKPELKWGE